MSAPTLWEEGHLTGSRVIRLSVLAGLLVLAVDLLLGPELSLLFDLGFVVLCVTAALAVRPADFFVVAVLPPLLLLGLVIGAAGLGNTLGIAIGSLLVVLFTAFTDVNSITPVLAVMIGLAVGIDYALFILSRYRSERARGLTKADAVGMATGTAGSSVVFAGLTVIVALAALVIAQVPFLSLMGISAAITVGIAVIISLTLLPALMALFGKKIFAGKVPGIAGNPFKSGRRPLIGGKTMGRRWVEAESQLNRLVDEAAAKDPEVTAARRRLEEAEAALKRATP